MHQQTLMMQKYTPLVLVQIQLQTQIQTIINHLTVEVTIQTLVLIIRKCCISKIQILLLIH